MTCRCSIHVGIPNVVVMCGTKQYVDNVTWWYRNTQSLMTGPMQSWDLLMTVHITLPVYILILVWMISKDTALTACACTCTYTCTGVCHFSRAYAVSKLDNLISTFISICVLILSTLELLIIVYTWMFQHVTLAYVYACTYNCAGKWTLRQQYMCMCSQIQVKPLLYMTCAHSMRTAYMYNTW